MPRYFVDVLLGAMLVRDTEDEDFEEMDAARNRAVERFDKLLHASLRLEESWSDGQIEITDECGPTVASAPPISP